MGSRSAAFRHALAATVLAALSASALYAQDGASRAVVQPLPPPEASQLSEALRRLATDPRDIEALIAAGNASLKLDDIDAALGFFARADEVAPGNPRAKAGLAAAMVKEENPFDALRLFDEAERAGAPLAELTSERALAYDLVGDNGRAQQLYREVLERGEDAETSRRLAVSLAISGDQAGMERVLLPMLQRRDLAAYRARAFALAILGKGEEAQTISDAVMPASMAARVAPYLRYMPRLTRAQQAAAANLGNFPRTAEIGRDDARIAQYVSGTPIPAAPPVQTADARLVPTGEPLGPSSDEGRRRPGRADAEEVALVAAAQPEPPPVAAAVVEQPEPEPALTEVALAEPPRPTLSIAGPPSGAAATEPAPSPVPAAEPVFDLARIAGSVEAVAQADVVPEQAGAVVEPVVLAVSEPGPSSQALPEPEPVQVAVAEPVVQAVAEPPASAPEPTPAPANVANAFADFELALSPNAPPADAVDLTRISAPRERPAPKEPAKPAHPARHWVQLATAPDRAGLTRDFRRISGNSKGLLNDAKGYLADWGNTNRLLTGPFRSESAAQAMVTRLDEAGIKAFTFSSKEGEEVTAIAAR